MKQYITRIFISAILSVQCLYPAATKDLSAADYAREIKLWCKILKDIKPNCTKQQACAALLKFEDLLYAPEPRDSGAASSSNQDADRAPSDKPLKSYIEDLDKKLTNTKTVYILCEIEEACALLLKSARRRHAQSGSVEFFNNSKSSKSCLWRSIKDLDVGVRALKVWYKICCEFVPNCTLKKAATSILMHQTRILKPDRSFSELYGSCHSALLDQKEDLSKIEADVAEEKVYAFCLKYPMKALTYEELHELATASPYKEEYQRFKDKRAARLKHQPTYVEPYRKHLASMPKLPKASYLINGKPEMDATWQKVVLAGYPDALKFYLELFEVHKNSPERIAQMKSFYFLHGHPGGGKTSAAYMIAKLLNRPYLEVRCPGLQTVYRASAVTNLEAILAPIFDSFDPWVICLDEIDALQRTDGRSDQASSSQGRSQALSLLQQMKDNCDNPNIIIIATSNYKNEIPASIMDRIGVGAVHIPMPDYETRKQIAEFLLQKRNIIYSQEILDTIAHETGGMVPSLTTGLSSRAIGDVVFKMSEFIAIENAQKDDLLEQVSIATPEITHRAIMRVREAISEGGQPITGEGRWFKECLDSKHFWPAVGTVFSIYNAIQSTISAWHGAQVSSEQLALSRAGLRLQESGEARAMRDEERAMRDEERHIEQLEISRDQQEYTEFQMANMRNPYNDYELWTDLYREPEVIKSSRRRIRQKICDNAKSRE